MCIRDRSCTSATVTQRFKDSQSEPTQGNASPVYVNKIKADIKAPQLRWNSTDTDTIDVTGGIVNMYGQPGKTIITFTAADKSYDIPWTPGERTLNVKNVLPTGVDYVWRARVVGDDPALNNETGDERLKDADRYRPPAQPAPTSSPSKNLSASSSASRNVRLNKTSNAHAGTVTKKTAIRNTTTVSPMMLFQHRQQIQALGLRAWRTPSTKEQCIMTIIPQQQGVIIQ